MGPAMRSKAQAIKAAQMKDAQPCECSHQQAAHEHIACNAGLPNGAYVTIGRCLTCSCASFKKIGQKRP
jgi:hypothetical protein